jgi:hypothetical protein
MIFPPQHENSNSDQIFLSSGKWNLGEKLIFHDFSQFSIERVQIFDIEKRKFFLHVGEISLRLWNNGGHVVSVIFLTLRQAIFLYGKFIPKSKRKTKENIYKKISIHMKRLYELCFELCAPVINN